MDALLAGLGSAEAERRRVELGPDQIESRDGHTLSQTLRSVASVLAIRAASVFLGRPRVGMTAGTRRPTLVAQGR